MRHLFLINPAAGKGDLCRELERKIAALPVPCEVAYTTAAMDAYHLAQEAAQCGEPLRIYACGGDGTLNEVVNGVAGQSHVAVSNVPLGTGNDFLKLFGVENRHRFSDLEALIQGEEAVFDLMECNGRLGLDIICAGVDARIAADVHMYRRLPLVKGVGAYILSLVSNVLFKGITRPMAVEAGEFSYEGETTLVCVCNGRHYGGGFMPVGDNWPDDGTLELLVVPKVSRFTFFKLVGKYAKGQYRQFPHLIHKVEGTHFRISAPQPLVVIVDGEQLRGTQFTIALSPHKLRFVYPQGLSYAPRQN